MTTVPPSKVATPEQAEERLLPPRVQEALGELVGQANEGLLALSVGVGLSVVCELLEEEVEEVVGPRGKHDRDRAAVRHGREWGTVAREAPPHGVAVVIRHRPGRDEDNTWEGWLGTLTGASWARDVWPDGAPFASRRLQAVASISEPGLEVAVRYELIVAGAQDPGSEPLPDQALAERPAETVAEDDDHGELRTEEQFLAAVEAGDVIVISTSRLCPACLFWSTYVSSTASGSSSTSCSHWNTSTPSSRIVWMTPTA